MWRLFDSLLSKDYPQTHQQDGRQTSLLRKCPAVRGSRFQEGEEGKEKIKLLNNEYNQAGASPMLGQRTISGIQHAGWSGGICKWTDNMQVHKPEKFGMWCARGIGLNQRWSRWSAERHCDSVLVKFAEDLRLKPEVSPTLSIQIIKTWAESDHPMDSRNFAAERGSRLDPFLQSS